MKTLQNFSMFYGKDQNLLDSQMSEISQRILSNFQKMIFEMLEKPRKTVSKMLELEYNICSNLELEKT